MDKTSYLIITYNGENHIKRCIESIRNFDKDGFILVIDNASIDNTVSIAEKTQSNKIIQLNENLGFGKSNNIGLKYLYDKGFEYFYLVNQDLYFESGNYDNFFKVVEKYSKMNYGIISPIHLAPNVEDFDFKFKAYISEKNTPKLLLDFKKGVLAEIYDSKVVNAAAWILSRKAIEEVGYFDPLFAHYGEDTDYLNRMKFRNIKIGISPLFKVIHNRPQIESVKLEKINNSIRIWALTHLKDINVPLIKKIAKFPIILKERVKKTDLDWYVYFNVLFFILKKVPVIVRSRKFSKHKMAFAEFIPNFE